MGAFYSNISARFRQYDSVYFLFVPVAGLICYKFLFNTTKASPLVLASQMERAFALFTVLFFAFVIAALLTILLSSNLLLRSPAASAIGRRIALVVFAAMTTLLALVMVENFTYTMFRIGIKNTDGVFAKLIYLATTAGMFWFFLSAGESYRVKLRESKFFIGNTFMAVASVFAVINLTGNMNVWASPEPVFPEQHNVIILSSDGIDANRMSLYGYKRRTTPFIDSIRGELLIARNAYPNNGHTTGAITSLLTGMLPTRTKVVFPPDSLSGENSYRSLPRLLRNQGYYANNIAVPHYADASDQNMLGAFDINNNRSMLSSSFPVSFNYKATNWFFDRLLSEAVGITEDVFWLREMPNPYAQVDGNTRSSRLGFNDARRLKSLISEIRRANRPLFINSHFLGTHGPFFNPEVVKFSATTTKRNQPWNDDLYDDALLTFDGYVARVYAELKAKGILENTILVIMSDHGIAHDPRKKIPLMVRFPDQKYGGTTIERNVQVIDIAPTVISALGGRKPVWMEGDSLLGQRISAARPIFSTSVLSSSADETIGFVPNVGVVRRDASRSGTMDYFYMVHCDTKYRLNVTSGGFDVEKDKHRTSGCSDTQRLNRTAAKQLMREHLAARY
ncbi:MAG TPA: sulfatase-like hydrolase/transferase [Hyphomicrobiaceae bacterium]|nr:sulfatase-like hydrolase/transferase [Hyphomicrobiaceae bacterium]